MSDAEYLDWRGRRRFHLALAGILVVWLSPLVSWWLAIRQARRGPGKWARILFALAVVDTLVFVCLLAFVLKATGSHPRDAASDHPRRIGVALSASEPPDGVKIVGVAAGSPAQRAGLRAGDEIERLDGKPVRKNARFSQAMAETPSAQARRLHVRRGNSEFDVSVVPALGVKSPPRPTLRLFAPSTKTALRGALPRALKDTPEMLGPLLILLAIAVVARRRRVHLRSLGHVASGWVVALTVSWVVLLVFWKATGLSLGAALISMLVAELAMLFVAVFAMRRLDRTAIATAQPTSAPLGTLSAIGRGMLYTVAGLARAGACVAGLSLMLHLPDHSVSEVLPVSLAWGGAGIGLVTVTTVLLAPVAEECLFRGVLLPWLATWMKPELAIVVSALAFGAGHLYYGAGALIPFVYGLVLGWMRLRTGRLRSGIALHMIINAVATAVAVWGGSR
jgi:membrane protease YdiL (CAAX protease family)